MSKQKVSMYLCYLLRHRPEDLGLHMDRHGYVEIGELIEKINAGGKYRLDREELAQIVAGDQKGRYSVRDGKIAACQGHSIPWVEPELTEALPPARLYHGTTAQAWEQIRKDGEIRRMERHAVHLQEDPEKAWRSALRWKKTPVLLVIDAGKMAGDGYAFGVSLNDVWCTERVPTDYILEARFDL